MSFEILALICLIGLLGPLLAVKKSWHLPIVLGELLAGVAFGRTGFGIIDPTEPTLKFVAQIGFALVMFVVGTHVPMRDKRLRSAFGMGLLKVAVISVVAIGIALLIGGVFNDRHWQLYAVVMASSSAAIILPLIDSVGLHGPKVIAILPTIAIADVLCLVALPLAVEPPHAARALLGVVLVLLAGLLLYAVLHRLERSGLRQRVHRVSERRLFAVELRVSLLVLFGLAAMATALGISVMLAGFVLGLVVSRVGEPRRVAHQVFAITEGFFGPIFFVWLGATLQFRDLANHPRTIMLGLALCLGAVVCHLTLVLFSTPIALSVVTAAQMGVPVAAATVGTELGVLDPGESSALMLSIVITLVATMGAGAVAVRRQSPTDGPGPAAIPRPGPAR